MEEIEEVIKAQAGFSLTEHKLELKGVCDECRDKKFKRLILNFYLCPIFICYLKIYLLL